jgi:lipoate-protein ligase A
LSETWRYVDCGAVDAFENNAQMAVLARSATDAAQPIVLDALDRLGLGEVRFEGSADLRWHGRKLGGLSAGDFGRVTSVGGFLNIKPPDLDQYLRVVRVPDDKFKDKLVKDMREYVCTAADVTGNAVTYEEFRDAVVAAARKVGIELDARTLTDVEQAALKKISNRIATDDSVRRVSSERFRAEHQVAGQWVGFGNHKGRKLCRAGVAIDGDGTIVAAMMAGDMHVSPPDTIDRVGAALADADASDDDDLERRIASVLEAPDVHQADATTGVTTDDLLAALRKAVENAKEGPA